ncbi:MAG: TldD/PmbA family protein, partial [Actinomycetota bacterium]|nr:TldD/PmbA family protein [Actinomycetota bacterium]
MREIIAAALNAAQIAGATYADARIVDTRREEISVANGRVEGVESNASFGIGVRVIADGSWGFSASSEVTTDSATKVAQQAVAIARASATVPGDPVRLAPVDAYEDRWSGACAIDPFSVPLQEKLDVLLSADETLRANDKVALTKAHMGFCKVHKHFGSTLGSFIEQDHVETGAGIVAYAVEGGEVLSRSYPNSHGGDWIQGGWEVIEQIDLPSNSSRVAREAAELLTAAACPTGEVDLIIDGSQLGLQVHESVGHPTELDRVLGDEAAFAGTSFLGLEDLDTLRYGSEHVTITADATVPGSLGSFGYDDEGVPAQRDPIVSEGLLTGFLTSRESATAIDRTSNGCMRADGWNRIPLIRMTTVSLEPGDWSFKDLIADTEDGLYIETNNSRSIDDKRLNFQFACEIGWEIKNGELGRMVKNPNYTGITPEFWNSCDAVCSSDHWRVWG